MQAKLQINVFKELLTASKTFYNPEPDTNELVGYVYFTFRNGVVSAYAKKGSLLTKITCEYEGDNFDAYIKTTKFCYGNLETVIISVADDVTTVSFENSIDDIKYTFLHPKREDSKITLEDLYLSIMPNKWNMFQLAQPMSFPQIISRAILAIALRRIHRTEIITIENLNNFAIRVESISGEKRGSIKTETILFMPKVVIRE